MGLTMLLLLCKIWLTLLIMMVPLRILADYAEYHWFDDIKYKIVQLVYTLFGVLIVVLFFVLVLIEVWSWQ